MGAEVVIGRRHDAHLAGAYFGISSAVGQWSGSMLIKRRQDQERGPSEGDSGHAAASAQVAVQPSPSRRQVLWHFQQATPWRFHHGRSL
jgi:hypothetical protein